MKGNWVPRIYFVAGGWGIVAALVAAHLSHVPGLTFDVVTAVILFVAGRAAKQQALGPWKVGALAGAIYGVLSGWPALLVHVTRAQLLHSTPAQLRGQLTPAEVTRALQVVNSPLTHVISWLGAVVVGVVLGLVLGAIGGMTVKGDGPPGPA
jgi:hypothetical protein